MKKFYSILVISLILSSCAPANSASTETTIPLTTTATELPTSTYPPPVTPSITPTLPVTAIPPLPESIEFIYEESTPEWVVDLVKTTVQQAYWFYLDLGCSPSSFKAKITKEENGEVIAVDEFVVGWEDLEIDPSIMKQRVAHETAHIMCQLVFTRHYNMGAIDLRWLTEGVPNYYAAMEQVTHTGLNSGVPINNIDEQTQGMAEWISSNFCEVPLKTLEPGNADEILREFSGVGDVATRLLIKINPNDFQGVVKYYTLLSSKPNNVAFQEAFGMSKAEFYEIFKDECDKGFPTLTSSFHETPVVIATPVLKDGYVRVKGNVILKDKNQNFSDYIISFCKTTDEQCLPGVLINGDGTFNTTLAPGKYLLTVNLLDSGEAIGWYTSKGLTINGNCAETTQVILGQDTNIEINLHFRSCLP